MEVDVFIPCFIDQVYPQVGMNMIKILQKLDVTVHYNPNQTCCGQMAFNSGYWDEARSLGEKFMKDFSAGRIVVGPSASCIGMVKNYYPLIFHNTSKHNELKQLRSNMYEISDFLVNKLNVTRLGAVFNHKVTVHDACAAKREYGLTHEVRTLLSHVKGLEIVEMKESDECCGFGGTFSVKHEAVSTAMAEQKIENAMATGAEYIVSTESSCLMHQEAYIKKHKLPIKTIHIVDILASGWDL
ncbi:MAG: (Fe-S)-binding protein [Bacteroidales bacterium]|nr:(Fe-S)-binding protein [Bacteroidales bacterium]